MTVLLDGGVVASSLALVTCTGSCLLVSHVGVHVFGYKAWARPGGSRGVALSP